MNQVLVMAIKDLRLLFRDKLGAFFIIGFPILMGIFFGMVMGGPSSGSDRAKMKIAIVDLDQSALSAKFISQLANNGSIELIETDLEPAKESVRKGQRLAMLVLTEGFGETAGIFWEKPPTIQIGVDPSRSAESAMLQGMILESPEVLCEPSTFVASLVAIFLSKLETFPSLIVASEIQPFPSSPLQVTKMP